MNWEAISALAAIFSAIAVVITLVYLAREVRQNTKATRAATRHAVTESIMGPPNNFLQSDSFRKSFLAHLNGEDLNPDQAFQLHAYAYITMKSWENMHYQYQSGMLTDEDWQPLRANLHFILSSHVWRDYWRREQQIYSRAFREEVDQILSELDAEKEDQRTAPLGDLNSYLNKQKKT